RPVQRRIGDVDAAEAVDHVEFRLAQAEQYVVEAGACEAYDPLIAVEDLDLLFEGRLFHVNDVDAAVLEDPLQLQLAERLPAVQPGPRYVDRSIPGRGLRAQMLPRHSLE